MPESPENDAPAHCGPSLLGRQTRGLSNYLWVAIAVTLVLGGIPRGARRALESNTNKAEDWLPATYAESADLAWFRDHFIGEAFVLVTWDGCTLGDTEKLRLLEGKLRAEKDRAGWAWFPRVLTGPDLLEELTTGPAGLTRSQAIARIEGALVGPEKSDAEGNPLGDGSRTTCLLAYLDDRLTDSNLQMRLAVERVRDLAHEQCGVPLANIHMGGPPVDNITIDIEGERTLFRLAGLSGVVGIALAYLCFRSVKLTAMVFWAAGVSAAASLAVVYWFGVLEVLGLGAASPRLGRTDAILMSMPAVVYVLALSGAIHLVNYYRDERLSRGLWGAAERAAMVGWGPCLLAAFTTAVGLGSLGTSDILPIQKFGVFSAIGVLVAVGLLFAILPVFLHCFPPGRNVIEERAAGRSKTTNDAWHAPISRFVTTRHGLTTAVCLVAMVAIAYGATRIETSVQLLKLLDEECDLITDYEWLEDNLGNLVPMEVIVALDADQLRPADQVAVDLEEETPRYRMTMFERAELVRAMQAAIEELEPISRALCATTFAGEPADSGASSTEQQRTAYTTSELLERSREDLAEYLRPEHDADGEPTGRELWRVSARVTALGDIDYGQFVSALREKVEPLMTAYRQRDRLVAELAEEGTALDRASLCLLVPTADADAPRSAPTGSAARRLEELLRDSIPRGRGRGVTVLPIDQFAAATPEQQASTKARLAERFDAVVTLESVLDADLSGVELTKLDSDPAGSVRPPATEAATVYTGVVPVVYKTQRQLLASLRESIGWATVLIAGVMVFVLRSPAAGLVSMIPNVFPIAVVFGTLGWLGIKVDIGIMMTASVALGVAVDDTLHFVTWFRRGIRSGLDRQTATRQAFERCATAMTQTTLIGGLGLAVFAVSTFTPTQQFGTLMIAMLGAALVGDLVLLPAILCGPLGRFFAPGAPAKSDETQGPAADTRDEDGGELTNEEPDAPDAPVAAAAPIEDAPEQASGRITPHFNLAPANAELHRKLQRLRHAPSPEHGAGG